MARTLEQDWETALGEQAHLLADHERFQRERPQAPITVTMIRSRGTPTTIPHRRPDEWTINELAAEIGAPPGTIYYWVQKGRLSSRSVEVLGTFNKLVTADAATIAKLKAARATPLPFRRALLPSVTPNPPTLDS